MTYAEVLRRIKSERILHDVMLELTYDCNLDCFFCYNEKDATGQRLSLSQYVHLLDDLVKLETLNVTLTGGEPLLHPHFFEIGQAARERGFVTRIKTGGHGLGGRVAQRVKREIDPFALEISLHGATAEVHDRQTRVPGSFDYLVQNVPQLKEMGLRPFFISAMTRWNEHQVEEMLDLANSMGVLLRFQGPVVPRDNGDREPLEIQPTAEGWQGYQAVMERRNETPDSGCAQEPPDESVKDPLPKSLGTDESTPYCGTGSDSVLIDPFGQVYPCVRLRRSAGSLHEQSIESIWNGANALAEARSISIQTSARIRLEGPLSNMGAPTFCPGVEMMGCESGCGGCG